MRVLALFLVILSSIGSPAHAQSATAALGTEENQFYQMLNRFRQILNVPRLDLDPNLESAARSHSDWMEANGILNHYELSRAFSPYTRMTNAGYSANYTWAGENIACGNETAVDTFRQWAFSPGHLQNMVNGHYHDTGIARSGTGDEHCPYYWTNDFASTANLAYDPTSPTDLSAITAAIVTVSGAIPNDTVISLNEGSQPTPVTPVPAQPESTPPPAQPNPTSPSIPSGDQDSLWQRLFTQLSTGASKVGPQTSPVSSFECEVPYEVGKSILTYYQGTDTLIEATKNTNGSFSVKLSYYQDGALSTLYPISLNGLTLTQNPDFPLVTLYSPGGSRVGGFSLQINTHTNQAQFDSIGLFPGISGQIMCSFQ